jgi:hypothetical protein
MAADHLRKTIDEYEEYIEILDKAFELQAKQDPKFKLGIEASEKYARAFHLARQIITAD